MKTIFILLLTTLSFTVSAQEAEELNQRILKLETQQAEIQLNLKKSQKQFSTGTFFLLGGFATTIVAGILYNQGMQNDNNSDNAGVVKPSPILLCIGGGMMTAGAVIQLDAHKWIGRAGGKRK